MAITHLVITADV